MNTQAKILLAFLATIAILWAIQPEYAGFALLISTAAYFLLRSNKPQQGLKTAPQGDQLVVDMSEVVDVVGEASYQPNLLRLAGEKAATSKHHICIATLNPEPTNPHDPNAVRVEIEGLTVGYLCREDAQLYATKGGQTQRVHAIIDGGWKNSESEGHFGVKLVNVPELQ